MLQAELLVSSGLVVEVEVDPLLNHQEKVVDLVDLMLEVEMEHHPHHNLSPSNELLMENKTLEVEEVLTVLALIIMYHQLLVEVVLALSSSHIPPDK
tara:strand:+ start:873 stop:1163 length:291 start_codon:yes stop_codon:yes gene_type:complete